MRATGIVRRIDELGRVVIPKEIRRTQRIKSGDSLEIFTDKNGEVVFKKYSPLAELGEPAALYADVLARRLQCAVLVCDRERVVAAAGAGGGPGCRGLRCRPRWRLCWPGASCTPPRLPGHACRWGRGTRCFALRRYWPAAIWRAACCCPARRVTHCPMPRPCRPPRSLQSFWRAGWRSDEGRCPCRAARLHRGGGGGARPLHI